MKQTRECQWEQMRSEGEGPGLGGTGRDGAAFSMKRAVRGRRWRDLSPKKTLAGKESVSVLETSPFLGRTGTCIFLKILLY